MSRDPLKAARAEVDALAAELASLEALAEKHAAAAGEAARQHRQGGATSNELQAAVSARQAIDFARDEIKRDLEAARAQVAEMESAADDEQHLSVIAAATLAYNEAEREHRELLTSTEYAIARAITRSADLTRAASAAKTQASDMALKLAAKHAAELPDMLVRAVNGADVPPLKPGAIVTKWPEGNRQRYKLVSQVRAKTQGVRVPEDGDAAA